MRGRLPTELSPNPVCPLLQVEPMTCPQAFPHARPRLRRELSGIWCRSCGPLDPGDAGRPWGEDLIRPPPDTRWFYGGRGSEGGGGRSVSFAKASMIGQIGGIVLKS